MSEIATGAEGAWSYRTGEWFAVFGTNATVLLPSSQKDQVVGIWSLVDGGAGFDEVLDGLLASGLSRLPGFVLISSGEAPTRVLLRGQGVQATLTADGEEVVLDGAASHTWVERTVEDVTALSVTVPAGEGPTDAGDRPILTGLVRVSRVDRPGVSAAAPSPAPVPVPVPEADTGTSSDAGSGPELDASPAFSAPPPPATPLPPAPSFPPAPPAPPAPSMPPVPPLPPVPPVPASPLGGAHLAAPLSETPLSEVEGDDVETAEDFEPDEPLEGSEGTDEYVEPVEPVEASPLDEGPATELMDQIDPELLDDAGDNHATDAPADTPTDGPAGAPAGVSTEVTIDPSADPLTDPLPVQPEAPAPDGWVTPWDSATSGDADRSADATDAGSPVHAESPDDADDADAADDSADSGTSSDPDPLAEPDTPAVPSAPMLPLDGETEIAPAGWVPPPPGASGSDAPPLPVGAWEPIGSAVPPPPAGQEPAPFDPDHDGQTMSGPSAAAAAPMPGIPGQPPAPAITQPVATLLISDGQNIVVDRAVLIGRAPEARRFTSTEQPTLVTVPSRLHEISSTHVEVRPGTGADHGSAVVTDMGSTNGTVLVQPGLGPEDLKPGIAVQLIPGAIINLGDGITIQVTRP